MSDSYVDGNALGGLLAEMFGRDLTADRESCDHCGSIRPLAEVHVYWDAPGIVVRCPDCSTVLMVIARFDGNYRVSFVNLRWMEPAR